MAARPGSPVCLGSSWAEVGMETPGRQRVVLALVSVTALVAAYALLSNTYRFVDPSLLPRPLTRALRPEILPPAQSIVEAFINLVTGRPQATHGGHVHIMDHLGYLADQQVTLQGALLVSAARVMFGVAVGGTLGILAGLAMGWSPVIDDYLHPIYVLARSIPPLALITYVMLWLGHGEAHLLVPVVYAVFMTVLIPTYHGIRDVAPVYVVAARSLGAAGRLLWLRVVLPAVTPAVLSALRYSIVIAWMTAVGAEMLMGNNGMGHLLAGGGLWAGREEIRVDPAVVIAGILGLATLGWVMDAAVRLMTARLTSWSTRRKHW